MPEDDLKTRREFCERLQAIRAQYPELATPESQERLATELARQEPREDPDDGVQTDW